MRWPRLLVLGALLIHFQAKACWGLLGEIREVGEKHGVCPNPAAPTPLTDIGAPGICCLTESQNHRMVGVGRDLCGSSSPTLLPPPAFAGLLLPKPGHSQPCPVQTSQPQFPSKAASHYCRSHQPPSQATPHAQVFPVLPFASISKDVLISFYCLELFWGLL